MKIENAYRYAYGKVYYQCDLDSGQKGQRAGNLLRNGCRMIQFDGQQFPEERVIWLLIFGRWPIYTIDHIDHDPTNNLIENLREVSLSLYTLTNTSPVFWDKINNLWMINVKWQGTSVFKEYFESYVEAREKGRIVQDSLFATQYKKFVSNIEETKNEL